MPLERWKTARSGDKAQRLPRRASGKTGQLVRVLLMNRNAEQRNLTDRVKDRASGSRARIAATSRSSQWIMKESKSGFDDEVQTTPLVSVASCLCSVLLSSSTALAADRIEGRVEEGRGPIANAAVTLWAAELAGVLRQHVAGQAIGARVARAGREPLRYAPSRQPCYGLATRMIGTQALRQKNPGRDGRRVNPSLPTRACLTPRRAEGLLIDERREIHTSMPARPPNALRNVANIWASLLRVCVVHNTLFAKMAFNPYQSPHNNLQ